MEDFLMTAMQYGYIRVSTKEQNTDRQWDALLKYGIPASKIFIDKQSGKSFNRPQYKKLLRTARRGDCIVITSLDRLGRNYAEIKEQWRLITKVYKIDILVLDMPLLNTQKNKESLMGIFLADMVLQILSYVAETERNNIRKRQAEGIASAKSRGVQFGRKIKPLPKDFFQIVDLWEGGRITATEAARRLQAALIVSFASVNRPIQPLASCTRSRAFLFPFLQERKLGLLCQVSTSPCKFV